jgi:hypothetical protein
MGSIMPKLNLADDDKAQFANFLKHRRLNTTAVATFAKIREENEIKATELHAAKNLSYNEIADNLIKAVNKGWMTLEELVEMLDGSELAGKQHVCVFQLPDEGRNKILATLRSPTGTIADNPAISEFLVLPTHSKVRVLKNTADEVVLKIVTRRDYWTTNCLEAEPTRELYERLKYQGRSAVIVKCNMTTGLVQIRVPPREKGPSETAKVVYEFGLQAMGKHLPLDDGSWFTQLKQFPVAKAFPKILVLCHSLILG